MLLQAMGAELVSELAAAELTYHDVGATRRTLPSGYHHQHAARVIGKGAQTFTAAAAELLSWQAHLRAGLRVTASTATAQPGTVMLLGIAAGQVIHEPAPEAFQFQDKADDDHNQAGAHRAR